MADETANIISFPNRKRPPSVLYTTVEQLHSHELLFAAHALTTLAVERYAVSNDIEFYDLVGTAHLVLERLLLEGGRTA